MSFNVFASSGGSFHYQQSGLIEGDSFDWMNVFSAMLGMEPNIRGVIGAAIDYAKPDMSDLMAKIATREMLHNLNNVVSFLAMCTGSSSGWITVSCTNSHGWLWPATRSFARYNFMPGDNPGAELVKLIGPGLKETGMNNWGVLLALSTVLGKYSLAIGQDAKPTINIMMDH